VPYLSKVSHTEQLYEAEAVIFSKHMGMNRDWSSTMPGT
jgi:hypothetical protein